MEVLKKILNKHTLSLASNAVMPVVGMVTVSLLARNLSKPDFGYWILFQITFTLAILFRSGFLQTSLVKFYSGAAKERALNVAGSTWVLAFAITAFVGLISLLAYFLYPGDASVTITIKWFAIIFFCNLPSSIALWILQAEERFGQAFILQLVGQGLFLIGICVLMFLKLVNFQNVVYAYCICAAITSLFAIVTGWTKILALSHRSWECIKELLHFGKYSVTTSISSYMLRGSDTYIIKFMFADPSLVGIYYLPQRLMEAIEIPLRSFIATALPSMSAAIHRHNEKEMAAIIKKYAGILTILLIPVSIAGFIAADLVVDILGGAKFAPTAAANIFRIFMCFAILMPVDRFFGISLDILNMPQKNMTKVFIMLAVNISGDFLGIYLFHNIYGVAVASIFTFMVGVVYGYLVLKKHLDFTMAEIIQSGITELREMGINMLHKFKQRNAAPNAKHLP
jgi:O-antigen/teichoic acid export membrane protein